MATATHPNGRGRRLGGLSLGCMAAGLAATRGLGYAGVAAGPVIDLVRAGFEAGTVGGLADWYAVTVLFHRAPLPLRLFPLFDRHSALLARNRQRITDHLVDLVQNQWLTPEAIRGQLEGTSLAMALCSRLEDPASQRGLVEQLAKALAQHCDRLGSPEAEAFLEKALRDLVAEAGIAAAIGQWLERAIGAREHDILSGSLVTILERALDGEAVSQYLVEIISGVLGEYAGESVLKRLSVWLGQSTGVLDVDRFVSKVLLQARERVAQARTDPGHPIRVQVDACLLSFARDLQDPESPTAKQLGERRRRLAANADLAPVVRSITARLKETLRAGLATPDSDLRQVLAEGLARAIAEVRQAPERCAALDAVLREAVVGFVSENRPVIGEAVRVSLSPERLSDEQLVAQIEPRLADDLQFVRCNGAVVGFVAGVALAGAHRLISHWAG